MSRVINPPKRSVRYRDPLPVLRPRRLLPRPNHPTIIRIPPRTVPYHRPVNAAVPMYPLHPFRPGTMVKGIKPYPSIPEPDEKYRRHRRECIVRRRRNSSTRLTRRSKRYNRTRTRRNGPVMDPFRHPYPVRIHPCPPFHRTPNPNRQEGRNFLFRTIINFIIPRVRLHRFPAHPRPIRYLLLRAVSWIIRYRVHPPLYPLIHPPVIVHLRRYRARPVYSPRVRSQWGIFWTKVVNVDRVGVYNP